MKQASLTIWTTTLLLTLIILGVTFQAEATHQLPTPIAHWRLDETVVPAPGANQFVNPGFETYTVSPGVPDSWSNNGGATTQLSRETSLVHAGSNSLRITADGSSASPGVRQTFTLASGAWQLSAMARAVDASTTPALEISGSTAGLRGQPAGLTTYESLSVGYVSDGTTSRTFTADVINAASGRIGLFDEVALTQTVLAEDGAGSHDMALAYGLSSAGIINQPGRIGTAYNFDGVDDAIDGFLPSLAMTSPFTVTAWVHPTQCMHANGGGDPRIIDQSNGFGLVLTDDLEPDCRPRFIVRGLTTNSVTADNAIALNAWTHVAGVYTGTSLEIHVNGDLSESVATSGTPATTSGLTTIGNLPSSSSKRFWMGPIDDVRVYGLALNAADIRDLYLDPDHASRPTTTASTTVTTYTITGTHSHFLFQNTTSVLIECIGGGGGGGGSAGSVTASAGGAGGGAGGYTRKYLTSPPTRIQFTVGAGGAGGAAGNNAGAVGQNTVIVNPAITCFGGSGGPGMAAGATATAVNGGAGGSSSGGEVQGVGAAGGLGIRHDATFSIGGRGGASSLGAGGAERTTNGAGTVAPGVGGGGGGARSTDTAFAGGAGAAGVVIIWEFTDETQGPQGEPGEDGVDGAQGPIGPTGPVGPQGPEGPVVCDDENCTIVQVEGMEFVGISPEASWTILLFGAVMVWALFRKWWRVAVFSGISLLAVVFVEMGGLQDFIWTTPIGILLVVLAFGIDLMIINIRKAQADKDDPPA